MRKTFPNRQLAHVWAQHTPEPWHSDPLGRLRHHVTGAIERGEARAIVEQRATHSPKKRRAPDINKLLRARPRPGRYGAPLGARNVYTAAPGAKLYSQRVRFVDGDYASDGTYWGSGGGPLYAVFSADLETLAYFRARNSRDALAQFKEGHKA